MTDATFTVCVFQTTAALLSQQLSGCVFVTSNQWIYATVFLPNSLFHSFNLWGVPMSTSVCTPSLKWGVLVCRFIFPCHLWNAPPPPLTHKEWLKLLTWTSIRTVTTENPGTGWQQTSLQVKRVPFSIWEPQVPLTSLPSGPIIETQKICH